MPYSKLFEQIYYENNPDADTKHDFLDFPLDTESKPPMWMKESLFERILREEHLRENPLMVAKQTAKNPLYLALDKWLQDGSDNRTLTGVLQDFVAGQNVSSKSPFMPAVYQAGNQTFLEKPTVEAKLVATTVGSEERQKWVDELIKVLKKEFELHKARETPSEEDYRNIAGFFLVIEAHIPKDSYTPKTTGHRAIDIPRGH